jgi:hypothetical protein
LFLPHQAWYFHWSQKSALDTFTVRALHGRRRPDLPVPCASAFQFHISICVAAIIIYCWYSNNSYDFALVLLQNDTSGDQFAGNQDI